MPAVLVALIAAIAVYEFGLAYLPLYLVQQFTCYTAWVDKTCPLRSRCDEQHA